MGRSFFGRNKKLKSRPRDSSSSSSSSSGSKIPPIAPSPSFVRRVHDSDDLRKVFDQFDANRDGKISISELESVLRCLGGTAARPAEEAKAMMHAVDLDGDGFISLEEFLSANTTEASSAGCLEELRNAFSVYDRDRNGLISAEELHHVFRSMGDNTSLTACKKMIKSVDQNGDGAINFEEFMLMMTRSAPPLAS